jgi:hypothetical protein
MFGFFLEREGKETHPSSVLGEPVQFDGRIDC